MKMRKKISLMAAALALSAVMFMPQGSVYAETESEPRISLGVYIGAVDVGGKLDSIEEIDFNFEEGTAVTVYADSFATVKEAQ